jgi:hypothetical protein
MAAAVGAARASHRSRLNSERRAHGEARGCHVVCRPGLQAGHFEGVEIVSW